MADQTKPLVYLACPYSDPEFSVLEYRADMASIAAGRLMDEGVVVFSPLSHGHAIAILWEIPTHWEYWEKTCRAYLSCSHKLIVLMLDGWESSTGVQAEIKIAKELGIDIEFITQ